jgi:hypothetical protein
MVNGKMYIICIWENIVNARKVMFIYGKISRHCLMLSLWKFRIFEGLSYIESG